jgi:CRISPR-associated protein Csb2
MIGIQLEFAAGAMHAPPWARATRGEIEWPPEPWRLLQAIVQGWAHLERPEPERFIEILEQLSAPPTFRLPLATSGSLRIPASNARAVVAASARADAFDSVLSLEREHGVAAYAVWPTGALNESNLQLFDNVLREIRQFGSSSPVCLRRVENVPSGEHLYEVAPPGRNVPVGSIFLKRAAARAGLSGKMLLRALDRQGDVRDPDVDQMFKDTCEYTMSAHWGFLGRSGDETTRSKPVSYRLSVVAKNSVAVAITQTLPFAEAVRGALLASYSALHGRPTSCWLAGKNEQDGSPRRGHDHPHFFPLDLDRDGLIDSVDVYFPIGCTHDEYLALGAVRTAYDAGSLRGRVALEFTGEAPKQTGRVWHARAPIILDRFPKRRGHNGGREIDTPSDQLRRALLRRNFPEAHIVIWSPTSRYGSAPNAPLAAAFRRSRGSQPPYPAIGASLTFEREVAGPVALGRLAHFGLGNFALEAS